jgi:hypothetical protein
MGFTQPSLHLRLTCLCFTIANTGVTLPPDKVCPGKQASAHNSASPGVECMSKPGLVYPKSRSETKLALQLGVGKR